MSYIQNIKELRNLTGASLSDCKNALMWADGNMEASMRILRSLYHPVVVKPKPDWKISKEEYEKENYS